MQQNGRRNRARSFGSRSRRRCRIPPQFHYGVLRPVDAARLMVEDTGLSIQRPAGVPVENPFSLEAGTTTRFRYEIGLTNRPRFIPGQRWTHGTIARHLSRPDELNHTLPGRCGTPGWCRRRPPQTPRRQRFATASAARWCSRPDPATALVENRWHEIAGGSIASHPAVSRKTNSVLLTGYIRYTLSTCSRAKLCADCSRPSGVNVV